MFPFPEQVSVPHLHPSPLSLEPTPSGHPLPQPFQNPNLQRTDPIPADPGPKSARETKSVESEGVGVALGEAGLCMWV